MMFDAQGLESNGIQLSSKCVYTFLCDEINVSSRPLTGFLQTPQVHIIYPLEPEFLIMPRLPRLLCT